MGTVLELIPGRCSNGGRLIYDEIKRLRNIYVYHAAQIKRTMLQIVFSMAYQIMFTTLLDAPFDLLQIGSNHNCSFIRCEDM